VAADRSQREHRILDAGIETSFTCLAAARGRSWRRYRPAWRRTSACPGHAGSTCLAVCPPPQLDCRVVRPAGANAHRSSRSSIGCFSSSSSTRSSSRCLGELLELEAPSPCGVCSSLARRAASTSAARAFSRSCSHAAVRAGSSAKRRSRPRSLAPAPATSRASRSHPDATRARRARSHAAGSRSQMRSRGHDQERHWHR